MPEITEAELKKQIKGGNLASLYFLHGEEKYLLGVQAGRLAEKAAGNAFRDFNLQVLDGASSSIDEIAAAAEALPLMADRKCVMVKDLDMEARSAQDLSKLSELLENVPESTVLLFYQPTLLINYKKSAKWKKFIASFNKLGTTVHFAPKTDADLEKLLCTAAAKRYCDLSRANASRIIRSAGKDLQLLLHELEKVCAYTVQGEITAEAIDLLVTKNLETTVFLLSRAIVAGQYDKAYGILDQLFYQNEEPVAILAVLSSAYIDMYRVRSAVRAGKSCSDVARHFDYKGREFVLRNAERDSARFSGDMLRKSLSVLLEADLALKGARGDRRLVMEKLLAQLLYIVEKEKMA